MTTPTAKSTTLPRIIKSRNPFNMFFDYLIKYEKIVS
jgi:hypothetical protein